MTRTTRSSVLGRPRSTRWARVLLGAALALGACKTGNGGTTPPDPDKKGDGPVDTGPTVPARRYPAPPPPSAPKPIDFPDVASFTLPNGLTTYVIENHEVPIVDAELVIRCGDMDHPHVSGFTASMLGEGTRSRSKAKLDEAIEFVGGSLFASSGMHVTTVSARSLDTDLKLAMLLMADEVLNPLFPPAALGKLKQGAKANLRAARANPDVLADVLFGMAVYPEGHPYGQPLGTEAEIDAITVADLRKFHNTFYRANNAFLLLSGDITVDEAKPLVERAFGSWTKAGAEALPQNPLNRFTRYELPAALTVHLIDRPGSAQASIRVGNVALARNHEDWPSLEVANALLGGGPTSRLFSDLREERGLTYRIGSKVDLGQAPGTFLISTQTRTPTTGAMLAGIFEHIERIRRDDPPRLELEATVRALVGAFPLQIETPDQIVDKVKEQLIFGLPTGHWDGYRDGITKVELPDVHKAALRYIHALPVVVVVGDASELRPQIEQVLPGSEIVLYDDRLQRK